jgi:transposase
MTATGGRLGYTITDKPTYSDLARENEEFRCVIAELKKALEFERLKRRDLEWQISQLLNQKFNPSSEKVSVEQLELILESIEETSAESVQEPAAVTEAEVPPSEPEPRKRRPSKKTSVPDDIETEIIEIDPDCNKICPDTGKPREFVRWEESEKIERVPPVVKKVIIRRAVRAVKLDESDPLPKEPIVTAEMPAEYRVIPGCIAGVGLLVNILVSKYCDHLPLYRQESILKSRHGVTIDRNLMGHWLKKISELLAILYEALRRELLSGQYLQIDETFIRMIDPETKGKTKQAFFWVIKVPGGGVLFHFDAKRSLDVPLRLLAGMKGKLQSDGYSVYEALLKVSAASQVTLLFLFNCWAHARRKVRKALEANGADAAWYLAEIQRLYRVEAKARDAGYSIEQREALRAEEARPVLARIKARLAADEKNPAILPSSPLGKALSYIRERWPFLEAYAQAGNGEVEIDNNEVENAIRPTAVGKKNWLFIGHPKAGQMSAIIYTIIENCRVNGINPVAYLTDVLPRIQDHPHKRINELLPRQWAEARNAAASVAAANRNDGTDSTA